MYTYSSTYTDLLKFFTTGKVTGAFFFFKFNLHVPAALILAAMASAASVSDMSSKSSAAAPILPSLPARRHLKHNDHLKL
jgi:hypothetical protein